LVGTYCHGIPIEINWGDKDKCWGFDIIDIRPKELILTGAGNNICEFKRVKVRYEKGIKMSDIKAECSDNHCSWAMSVTMYEIKGLLRSKNLKESKVVDCILSHRG
jgi:hypothetical protein